MLKSNGCEEVQGFLFGEALPAEQFSTLLVQRAPGPWRSWAWPTRTKPHERAGMKPALRTRAEAVSSA